MKNIPGIVILVFVIFGFFSSYSLLAEEEISKDIAAFRTEFHTALDKIKKARVGKTLDQNTLSVAINNMKKILDDRKQRIAGEQRMEKGTKKKATSELSENKGGSPGRTADEATLKAMMDEVEKEMNTIEKEQNAELVESLKEPVARIIDMIKETQKIQEQTTETTIRP